MLLLTFTAGADRYAVNAARVVELVPRVELRPIPHAPAFLAGLLAYRGQVVPVIDLGLLLGAAACPERLSTRIILVNDGAGDHNRGEDERANPAGEIGRPGPDPDRHGRLLGLIAEQVSDLIAVGPEQVVPAPVHLPQAPYLDAIAQLEQGFVPVIALEKLSLVMGHSELGPGVGQGREGQGPGTQHDDPWLMTHD